jgi:IclR family transcriptional regulator, acetate operon repressor
MTGPVRSLSLGFAILRLLGEGRAMTLSEMGAALGLNPSSTFNLVRTLVHEGVVTQVGPGKRYGLVAAWGGLPVEPGAALIERARPAMARLAGAEGATIGLWRIAQGKRMQLVHHVEAGKDMVIQMKAGQRQPLGGGATGRALGAARGLDRTELARRFDEVRWQVPLDFAEYSRQVDTAHILGYAIDNGHGHAGICSLGVAMAPPHEDFCVSASIFAGSRDPAGIAQLGKALVELASDLR